MFLFVWNKTDSDSCLELCFHFLFSFLNAGLVAAFNCSSPTPSALFTELEKNLFSKKLMRPVQSFQKPLNVTISITLVDILGVVCLHTHTHTVIMSQFIVFQSALTNDFL